MRQQAPAQLAVVLLALSTTALVTLGIASRPSSLGSIAPRPTRPPRPVTESASSADAPSPLLPTDMPTGKPPVDLAPVIGPLFAILLVLAVLAVLAAIWWVLRRARQLRPDPAVEADATDLEAEFTIEQARDAFEEARSSLVAEVDARDAIIDAWLALEHVLEDSGVARHPSETTLEYVQRVLARIDLDQEDLAALAHLYRRCLFDQHPPGESDRERARALLDSLAASLAGARS